MQSRSSLQGEGNGIDNARPCPRAGGNDACSPSRVSQGQDPRFTMRVCRSRRASRRQRRPGATADQVLTTGVSSAMRSFFWTGVLCVFVNIPFGSLPRSKGDPFFCARKSWGRQTATQTSRWVSHRPRHLFMAPNPRMGAAGCPPPGLGKHTLGPSLGRHSAVACVRSIRMYHCWIGNTGWL